MIIQSKFYRYITLFIIAILCGAIWRIEVEYHGWNGLNWIGYYHWAVPISLIIFLFWANLLFDFSLKKRLAINAAALLISAFLLYWLSKFLVFLFNAGPSAMLMHFQMGEWTRLFYSYAIYILIPLFPISAAIILRLANVKCSWYYVAISVIAMFLSIPLACYILDWTNHIGGANYIHAIKSGVLIPFSLFSMGFVLIQTNKD